MKNFRRRNRNDREGIAVTECALCIPLIIMFTLFAIEVSTVLFLKETITIAAYEGSRIGIQRGGTDVNVENRIKGLLKERGVSFGSDVVEISDPSFDTAAALEHVTVTVNVPVNGNLFSGWIFEGRELDASVTMRKEYANPETN